MNPVLVISDLEGVFVPEIWPILGQKMNIPELALTTRDVNDFEQLMKLRLAAINGKKITFNEIKSVLSDIRPFKRTEDVMKAAYNLGARSTIITDSFEEFTDIILKNRYGWDIFANRFEINNGIITGCALKVGGKKGEVLNSIRKSNEIVIAIGDSFNDVKMLKAAQFKILFNPIPQLNGMFKDAVTCKSLESLITVLSELIKDR